MRNLSDLIRPSKDPQMTPKLGIWNYFSSHKA